MKIIITNVTGSQNEVATIDKDSGVIEFASGELTHILFEKHMNKTIKVFKEEKKPEVKKVEPEIKEPSTEQSKEGTKKKTKTK